MNVKFSLEELLVERHRIARNTLRSLDELLSKVEKFESGLRLALKAYTKKDVLIDINKDFIRSQNERISKLIDSIEAIVISDKIEFNGGIETIDLGVEPLAVLLEGLHDMKATESKDSKCTHMKPKNISDLMDLIFDTEYDFGQFDNNKKKDNLENYEGQMDLENPVSKPEEISEGSESAEKIGDSEDNGIARFKLTPLCHTFEQSKFVQFMLNGTGVPKDYALMWSGCHNRQSLVANIRKYNLKNPEAPIVKGTFADILEYHIIDPELSDMERFVKSKFVEKLSRGVHVPLNEALSVFPLSEKELMRLIKEYNKIFSNYIEKVNTVDTSDNNYSYFRMNCPK
jgi:hypothetical protein